MEDLVADVSELSFLIEYQLEEQIGLGRLPFPRMNKSGAGVCNFFLNNMCTRNNLCPFRHIKADRTVVCKHWLRGLCKKGDDCEFLHEFDMAKMPECYFYSKFGECMNKECPFLHIDPQSKVQDCPWYDRGFCRNGPICKNRHVRRVACKNYLNGLCLEGKICKYAHPRWWPLPGTEVSEGVKQRWICHHCKERGHKIQFCHKLPLEERQRLQELIQQRYQQSLNQASAGNLNQLQNSDDSQLLKQNESGAVGAPKPLDQVTCYKCGEKGHYANRCTKGYLAFLSKVSIQGSGDEPGSMNS